MDAHRDHTKELRRRERVATFALTWIAYVAFYLGRKNLSVVKTPLGQELGLSTSALGALDTAYLVAYACGQFLHGAVADRIAPRILVGAGLVVAALCNFFFGLSSAFAVLLALLILNGLAQSSGWPGCAKAFSQWFGRGERGTALGLWSTCYQVGPLVATALATFAMSMWGWRAAMLVPAAIVAAVGVLFFVRQRTPASLGLDSADGVPQGAPPAPLLTVLLDVDVWRLGLTYVVLKFIRYSFLFWLPFFMSTSLGYPAAEAGYLSLFFDLGGLAGAIAAGVLSDKLWKGRRVPVVVFMMLGLALATSGYAEAAAAGRFSNVIAMIFIGFLLYGPDSVAAGVAAIDAGRERAAAAAGFVNGLGSIGAALSGVVIAWVSEAYGWEATFALFSPLALLGALLMATGWKSEQRRLALGRIA